MYKYNLQISASLRINSLENSWYWTIAKSYVAIKGFWDVFFYGLRLFLLALSALSRVRRLPKMAPFHTARSCAASLLTPNLMSSVTYSCHVIQISTMTRHLLTWAYFCRVIDNWHCSITELKLNLPRNTNEWTWFVILSLLYSNLLLLFNIYENFWRRKLCCHNIVQPKLLQYVNWMRSWACTKFFPVQCTNYK